MEGGGRCSVGRVGIAHLKFWLGVPQCIIGLYWDGGVVQHGGVS